jgi:probable rRNA maturation factor
LRREVVGSGTPLAAHWAHMVVHGVLHLCGYDHQSEGDAGVMEGLENDVLQGFGFTNPYRVS